MTNTVREIQMIYCIHSVGADEFIFLNRKYKPLGVSSSEWVAYGEHPTRCKIKGLTDAKAETMGLTVSRNAGGKEPIYYLYEEATSPDESKANWERYQKILRNIMGLVVSQEHVAESA